MVGNSWLLHVYLYSQVHSCCRSCLLLATAARCTGKEVLRYQILHVNKMTLEQEQCNNFIVLWPFSSRHMLYPFSLRVCGKKMVVLSIMHILFRLIKPQTRGCLWKRYIWNKLEIIKIPNLLPLETIFARLSFNLFNLFNRFKKSVSV